MNTKEFENLNVDYKSTSPDDFIEVLNEISPEIGGVTNLGVFADIKSITPGYVLRTKESDEYINVKTSHDEAPFNTMRNDGSSIEPYDHNFDHLINHQSPINFNKE